MTTAGVEPPVAERTKQAAQAAGEVAGTAKEQAGRVAGEARDQARQLLRQSSEQLNRQAQEQTQRLATSIRKASEHFASMAEAGESDSAAQAMVRQAADRAQAAADYVEGKQPGDLIRDLQGLGRRHPGTFLLGAAAAGFAVGRMLTASRAATGTSPGEAGTPSAPPEVIDLTGIETAPEATPAEPYSTPSAGIR